MAFKSNIMIKMLLKIMIVWFLTRDLVFEFSTLRCVKDVNIDYDFLLFVWIATQYFILGIECPWCADENKGLIAGMTVEAKVKVKRIILGLCGI